MNDKCASGTGATIDKCMIKVGMPPDEVAQLQFDDSKLHHVAAKCGVFAETDIVNLVKTGIPSTEIMCSLADAIVMQNLSVLTRGNTLRHKVLLLGGPNTYLPFLQQCWRKRIPETWDERGYDYPKDVPIDELIIVPQNAELYAAYGAVMYGLHEGGRGRPLRTGSTSCARTSPKAARRAWARPRARRSRSRRRAGRLHARLHDPEVRAAKFEPGRSCAR